MKKNLFYILAMVVFVLSSCGNRSENREQSMNEEDSISVPQQHIRPSGDWRTIPNIKTRDTLTNDSISDVKE